MQNTISVTLRTPAKTYYDGEADKIALSTEEGALEIFPGHAPLTGVISFSEIEVYNGDRQEAFLVRNGFVFKDPGDKVRILIYACDPVGATDKKTIGEYRDYVLSQLKNPSELTSYQLQYLKEQRASLEKMVRVFSPASKEK